MEVHGDRLCRRRARIPRDGARLLRIAHAGGDTNAALNWSTLVRIAPRLDPGVLRLATGMVVLGYGTKVGLAPMHTWLPDAHSQAPAPVSALMSGVLLSVAFSCVDALQGHRRRRSRPRLSTWPSCSPARCCRSWLRPRCFLPNATTNVFSRIPASNTWAWSLSASRSVPRWRSRRRCCTSWGTGSAKRFCSAAQVRSFSPTERPRSPGYGPAHPAASLGRPVRARLVRAGLPLSRPGRCRR